MAIIPGTDAEVFFGDAEKPLPDWRQELPDKDDDDDELTSEERKAVIGMIGFDPAEIQNENGQKENKTISPKVKPSPFGQKSFASDKLYQLYEGFRNYSYDQIQREVEQLVSGMSATEVQALAREFNISRSLSSKRAAILAIIAKINDRKGSWERSQFR